MTAVVTPLGVLADAHGRVARDLAFPACSGEIAVTGQTGSQARIAAVIWAAEASR